MSAAADRRGPAAASRPRRAALALVLGALVVLVFLPALDCGFVHLDDPQTVPRYGAVMRGLTWDGVRLAFGEQFFGHWVPLTVLSLMLDWQLWGKVAYGHHLTSVLLHALNAVLVFLLWSRAVRAGEGRARDGWAAAVALLFALHPLRVEPVLWLTGRKDLLSAAGALLALLLYVRWREAPSRGRYAAVTVAFAAAILGKATALVVPALMLLLDLWPLGRVASPGAQWPVGRELAARLRPLLLEKLPWLAMSAAAGVGALLSARAGAAMAQLESVPLGERAATALVGYETYLRMTFAPAGLAAFYPFPAEGWSTVHVTVAALLFLVITAAALALVRRLPWLTVGWCWWVLCLLPVSGLLQAGEQAAADRYTYLASVGLAIAVFWSLAEAASKLRERRLSGALLAQLAAVLVACGFATRAQIATWRDSESVFRRMVEVTSGNHFGHLNLANVLAEQGDCPKPSSTTSARSACARISLSPGPVSAPPTAARATPPAPAGRSSAPSKRTRTSPPPTCSSPSSTKSRTRWGPPPATSRASSRSSPATHRPGKGWRRSSAAPVQLARRCRSSPPWRAASRARSSSSSCWSSSASARAPVRLFRANARTLRGPCPR